MNDYGVERRGNGCIRTKVRTKLNLIVSINDRAATSKYRTATSSTESKKRSVNVVDDEEEYLLHIASSFLTTKIVCTMKSYLQNIGSVQVGHRCPLQCADKTISSERMTRSLSREKKRAVEVSEVN
jgi:hypothetical protein